jgi:hypothetical protein
VVADEVGRPAKAADIDDAVFLDAVAACNDGRCTVSNLRHTWHGGAFVQGGHWCLIDDVVTALPGFPLKVVRAKARRLIGRGLMDGCGCGCRGDFEITAQGRALLG